MPIISPPTPPISPPITGNTFMPLSKYSGGMDEGTYTVAINKIIDALNAASTTLSSYGSFSDNSVLQAIVSTSSEQAITFDTVEVSDGVTLANYSQITLPTVGLYLLVFSALCSTASNQVQSVDIWLRKNGDSIVPRSSTRVSIPAQGHYAPMTVSVIVEATAVGDYYELMMCGSLDTNTGLATVAGTSEGPDRPDAPAIIVTVNKISVS